MIYGRVMLCNDLLMSTNISWNVDHFIRADKYLLVGPRVDTGFSGKHLLKLKDVV